MEKRYKLCTKTPNDFICGSVCRRTLVSDERSVKRFHTTDGVEAAGLSWTAQPPREYTRTCGAARVTTRSDALVIVLQVRRIPRACSSQDDAHLSVSIYLTGLPMFGSGRDFKPRMVRGKWHGEVAGADSPALRREMGVSHAPPRRPYPVSYTHLTLPTILLV